MQAADCEQRNAWITVCEEESDTQCWAYVISITGLEMKATVWMRLKGIVDLLDMGSR